MSHEIAETDANLHEIARLYADLAGAQQALAQAERQLVVEQYARRRLETAIRVWAEIHRIDDCPSCTALHKLAKEK